MTHSSPVHPRPVRPEATARRHSTPMLDQLDREWIRMRRRPGLVRTVRGWSNGPTFDDVLAGVTTLDEVVRATQPTGRDDGHLVVLTRLVEVAAVDDLAARIVLQRLLPGLVSQARRWDGIDGDVEPTDLLIGAAWIAIRGFDARRRSTRHIAPALIGDAVWTAFRRQRRRRSDTEVPVPNDILGVQPSPAADLEPIIALAATIRAAARAGVASKQLDVLRSIAMAGSPSRAAIQQQVTVRTIRNRRDVAGRCVRQALGPDWADWSDPLAAA